MGNLIDITGKRFNQLLVIRRVGTSIHGQPKWLCKCDCGNEIEACSDILRKKQKSCRDCFKKRNTKHGLSKHSAYHIFILMHERCYNPKTFGFSNYGGRGIQVCKRWFSLENFIKDMGDRPSALYSIERKNVHGNYTPTNCKWATDKEQSRNTTTNVHLTLNGRTATMIEWSEITQIPYATLQYRRKAKWTTDDMLTIGTQKKKPKRKIIQLA